MTSPQSLKELQRSAAYGLLLEGSRVLLVHAAGATGRWWLPGGGVEFGETPTECLVRELLEETGLRVEATELLDVVSDVMDYPERALRVHSTRVIYRAAVVGGHLRSEAEGSTDEAAWHELGAALSLPLVPFVRDLLQKLGGD